MKLSSGQLIKSLITRRRFAIGREKEGEGGKKKRKGSKKIPILRVFIFQSLVPVWPPCQIIPAFRYIRVWLADFDIKCEPANIVELATNPSSSPPPPIRGTYSFPFELLPFSRILIGSNSKIISRYALPSPRFMRIEYSRGWWNLISNRARSARGVKIRARS